MQRTTPIWTETGAPASAARCKGRGGRRRARRESTGGSMSVLVQPFGHLCGGCAGIGHAIGDADAAEAAACEEDSRVACERSLDGGDPVEVANFVLRGGALPS